jgi:CRAL/TRIO domain
MSILFDCSMFGFKNLDVSNMLYVMQCCESYFPETLATLYLHKAPWVLVSSWNACKGGCSASLSSLTSVLTLHCWEH